MTADDVKNIGLPIENTSPSNLLVIESAFEWILANTTLEFSVDDIDDLKALPSSVKLFVVKFCDVMNMAAGIASESIEGMSQSFDTTQKDMLIRQYADELLSTYLKSSVTFFRASNKWSDT